MTRKKKYYVVWEGHEPGIYDSWEKCQLQIKAYPGAKYKSFKTEAEAIKAFHGDYVDYTNQKEKKPLIPVDLVKHIERDSWSVDAACSGNPGKMEYRGVVTLTGEELFRQGPFLYGTNNIGEFLAIVHALALLKKRGDHGKIIYTDSKTALAWIRNRKVKTSLKENRDNKIIFELIQRAENWLKKNEYNNQILKWDTKVLGEIPADFGRK